MNEIADEFSQFSMEIKMSEDWANRTFTKLLKGEIDALHIAFCIGATRATREDVYEGIWKLDRASFVKIAESIVDKHRFTTIKAVAEACDEAGPENRFFRLNDGLAKWLDETQPEQEIDFIVM